MSEPSERLSDGAVACCARAGASRDGKKQEASRALSRDTAPVGETGPAPTKGAKLRDRLRVHPQSKHYRQW